MSAVWIGEAVPVNRKTVLGKIRTKFGIKTRVRTSEEYQKFVDDMAVCFSSLPKFGKAYVALYMQTRLGPRMDGDGVMKPVLDAIQRSGAVDNDFQVREKHIYDYIGTKGEPHIIVVDLRVIDWNPKRAPASSK